MKKKIIHSLLLVILLNGVFVSLPIFNIDVNASNKSKYFDYKLNSFNASSPYDYFNESKDPRYALVNKPLTFIQYPNKGYPCITTFNETITIILAIPEASQELNLTLVSNEFNISLQILDMTYSYSDTMWHIKAEPEQTRAGLYDLKLEFDSGVDYQTNSVKLIEKRKYPFSFIHISDSHFPSYSPNINSTAINLKVIENIKKSNPDFIIHTGDLIDGPSTVFVDPTTGKPLAAETQLKLALWALDKLEIPTFLVAGNHDYSESSLIPDVPKEVWYNYFDFNIIENFSFLDWDFIGYSSSFEGLDEDKFRELKTTLSTRSNDSDVFFYHYDFEQQASTLMKNYHVELALWGHSHKEKLYLSEGTLHHSQEPMFYSSTSYTEFFVNDSSALSINEQFYNTSSFDWVYSDDKNEQLSKTKISISYALFVLFSILVISVQTKRQRK